MEPFIMHTIEFRVTKLELGENGELRVEARAGLNGGNLRFFTADESLHIGDSLQLTRVFPDPRDGLQNGTLHLV